MAEGPRFVHVEGVITVDITQVLAVYVESLNQIRILFRTDPQGGKENPSIQFHTPKPKEVLKEIHQGIEQYLEK